MEGCIFLFCLSLHTSLHTRYPFRNDHPILNCFVASVQKHSSSLRLQSWHSLSPTLMICVDIYPSASIQGLYPTIAFVAYPPGPSLARSREQLLDNRVDTRGMASSASTQLVMVRRTS
ncbi:hypothetical protein M011DRAFT_243544 [Sporormia fimetaria CBS 119925]|uniref:Uncharacterized protein n=1 Tax=Sporormia fimetaria CBS 119925 TaxID=1340428 RepID=A0A6A6VIM1_9PLEO|nr:hypothetical protein M011DRAFT_243544 [Sporormia fimetaria CBS 119925]